MSEKMKDFEAQLEAMRLVVQALSPLDDDDREAVLIWVDSQFGRKLSAAPLRQAVLAPEKAPRGAREGTVSMVAQKIEAKSARDLLVAAAAFLTLFQSKGAFTKDELVTCAKEARGWKSAYSNQMALNVDRMIKAGVLFEKSKNVFSLSETTESEMQKKLA